MRTTILHRLRGLFRQAPPLEVWYDEAYRLPLPSLEAMAGLDPRRVDLVAWYLLQTRALKPSQLRTPELASWEDLHRAHDPAYLESLQTPQALAKIFAVDAREIPVEPLLRFVRLAAGGTITATRSVLITGGAALNLAGGFHHASRAHGGGFCAVNDLAAAVKRVRHEGFDGQVCVLDLDAHPPDGIVDCLKDDPKVWVGSLTASRWEHTGPVDEIVLPAETGDVPYLRALGELLGRMPKPELAFVVSGADILAGDRLGRLGLTLAGARERDHQAFLALEGVPQVWLPGGGYRPDAWRVLAGTGLVLAGRAHKRIPRSYDPLTRRFHRVSREMTAASLHGDDWTITEEDIFGELNAGPPPAPRVLGYYSPSGIEYGLYRQGILGHVRRMGYESLRVDVDTVGTGDRLRLFGTAEGGEHVLIEAILERCRIGGVEALFVNWLTLRNPRIRYTEGRPLLPGQEVPGLGLAREATMLLSLIAKRLGLQAVVFRPAWFHLARAGRSDYRFVDPERQGRFEALCRDTEGVPLAEISRAVSDGRVLLDGEPYAWEATDFAHYLSEPPEDPEWDRRRGAERERVRFELVGE